MFKLTTACKSCPFLKNSPMPLHPERLPSIVRDLEEGHTFTCHKTIDCDQQVIEDDAGIGFTNIEQNQFCAGALVFMEKMGRPNQAMRIAERLGLYDPSKLKGHDRVIDDLKERSLYPKR